MVNVFFKQIKTLNNDLEGNKKKASELEEEVHTELFIYK